MQAVHAAHEAGIRYGNDSGISSVVVCQVPDERTLLHEMERIERRGIYTVLFREPDIGNQATAFATELVDEVDRRAFANYKLWSPR